MTASNHWSSSLKSIGARGLNLDHGLQAVPGGFAFPSLNLAFRAYFETYSTMRHCLHLYDGDYSVDEIAGVTPPRFLELSGETILHLHHFTELIIKDLLRQVHPLLPDVASTKPVVLKKLLLGEALAPGEDATLKSIEFSEAWTRLHTLIDKKAYPDFQSFSFFKTHARMIDKLNELRNRLWHRGRHVLAYDSLDVFVCRHFVPFLLQLLALDRYRNTDHLWRYRPLACGFQPLEHLARIADPYDIGAYSLAKELGRAAYSNPLSDGGTWSAMFDHETVARAERSAAAAEVGARDVQQCPVCGKNALVLYDEIDNDGDPEGDGYNRAWRYTWQVECFCCSFSINHHLKEGREYGIAIPDYWDVEDL